MEVLLLAGEIEGDHLLVEIAARVKVGVLVLEVHRVAEPAHIEAGVFFFQKVDDDAVPCEHFDARLVLIGLLHHLKALFERKHAMLALVFGNGDRDLVKERKALFHGVVMPEREGIERPREYAFFHCSPPCARRKKVTRVRP